MGGNSFLQPGEPAPGGWHSDPERPDLKRWRGQSSWKVAHGPAVAHWLLGTPNWVENALLPDGSRGDVRSMGLLTGRDENNWRRPDGNGGWLYGEVELGGDAVFKDAASQPRPDPVVRADDGRPDLEADLAASTQLLAAVQDEDFAQALYAAMCNQDWRAGTSGRWSCSWRRAGGIVADLRGKGEIYNDWYCSGIGGDDVVPEGTVREDVRILLGQIGWHPLSREELEADHEVAASRIRELEQLPERDMPEWYRARLPRPDHPLKPDLETWSGCLRHLAATGRVEQAEWLRLCDLLDMEADRAVHEARAMAALTGAARDKDATADDEAPSADECPTSHGLPSGKPQ